MEILIERQRSFFQNDEGINEWVSWLSVQIVKSGAV